MKHFFREHYPYIFFSPHTMPNYYYHKGFVWIDIWGIDIEQLHLHRVLEHIEQLHERMDNWQNEKKYKEIFSFIEKKVSFPLFIQNFSIIPDEQKYDVFRNIYQRSEYNFHHLTPDFLETIFAYSKYSSDWKNERKKLNQVLDSEGYLTIYRGESSKSTRIENAWSWTLSYSIAHFFATRFSDKGIIYQAKVLSKNVADYIPDRKEEEILVHPKQVDIVAKKNVWKYEVDTEF
ncbi:metal-dependent phosphohydrolase [Brevibacillus sp. NPDC058079]|uniref:metal-dependent phosphohydrolase n=1 Tax=Brevibacillus sp. NPDC058079 TaxID=3346330 RepID=UPI0036E325E2